MCYAPILSSSRVTTNYIGADAQAVIGGLGNRQPFHAVERIRASKRGSEMIDLRLGRNALGVCAATMLAGCGGGSAPLSPSPVGVTAVPTHVRPAYSVLYSFKGGTSDGKYPEAGLLNINGTLHGTTAWGGGSGSCKTFSGLYGRGTVFAITRSGKETVLHSFTSKPDGAGLEEGLLNVNGTLYGTAAVGGANKAGTVLSISP
jgi:hypothetical protein